jgi:hypothetical protein
MLDLLTSEDSASPAKSQHGECHRHSASTQDKPQGACRIDFKNLSKNRLRPLTTPITHKFNQQPHNHPVKGIRG